MELCKENEEANANKWEKLMIEIGEMAVDKNLLVNGLWLQDILYLEREQYLHESFPMTLKK